jgi:hypothetical protein
LATSAKMEIDCKEPKCSICDYTYFKVERVSPDKIRLTCENCGEEHLIVISSEIIDHAILKFVDNDRK